MNRSKEDLSLLLHLLYFSSQLEELLGHRWRDFHDLLARAYARRTDDPRDARGLRLDLEEILALGRFSAADSLLRRLLHESRRGGPPLPPRKAEPSRFRAPTLPAPDLEILNGLRSLGLEEAESEARALPAMAEPPRRPVFKGGGDEAPEERSVRQRVETEPKAPVAASERRINAWIGELEKDSAAPLQRGETYTLKFKVGSPVEGSLLTGPESVVSPSEVPEGGLETRWVVTSSSIELAAPPADVEATAGPLESISGWKAGFSLFIPKEGESAVPQLRITPRSAADATLEVVIYARQEIYRQLTIRLSVGGTEAGAAATIVREICDAPEGHLNLRTPHEWTTPPGVLTLSILGDRASVRGAIGDGTEVEDVVEWLGGDPQIAGRIVNLHAAAERLRRGTERYLNAIEPADLLQRLAAFQPQYDWGQLQIQADATHEEEWDRVAASSELRELAFHGYNLYNAFFPQGRSRLRDWLDALPHGHRLNVSWLRGSGAGWLAHVPWGLMYRRPPVAGQPIDPMSFLGLCFRIDYSSRPQIGTKALGRVEDAFHAHLMYWGDDVPTGPESLWQRDLWKDWGKPIFRPDLPAPADPKGSLVDLLENPPSSPLTLLYLFCNCTVGDGNEPALRFANSNQPSALLRQAELGISDLVDKPLVFANACTTASADPYFANDLAARFFERGCRAFLGTETKVPIELASRFAAIFFQFFFRKIDPDPIAAGEAVAQARLFLWTQYRNLGGLFYTYVNRYELFMARDDEVAALRI